MGSANETDVNETSLEDDLEPLQIDDDERLDIEYIKKNFNSTSTSLNNTEEYDVEEEKDEITAPDNQDDEEEQEEQEEQEEYVDEEVTEENDQTLVEKSANETQVDVNMTDVNMTAVNQTELEEALKEIEEQGEDLDFNFINKTFNLSSM